MKKLFCIVTLVALLLGCMTLSAAADHDYADFGLNEPGGLTTLSEDLQVLTLKGHTYRRMDLTKFNLMLGGGVNLILSDSQKSTIESGLVYWDMDQVTAKVVLELAEGAQMTLYFVNDNHRNQIEALLSGNDILVRTNLNYTMEDPLIAPIADFRGPVITMDNRSLSGAYSFTVAAYVDGLQLSYTKGILLDDRSGTLYYLDYDDNGFAVNEYSQSMDITVQVHEVTNAALKAELNKNGVGVIDDGEVPDTFLSDDLQSLTLKGEIFRRMDLSGFELLLENSGSLHLSVVQKKNRQITTGSVSWDDDFNAAHVTLEYADGTQVSMYFINSSRYYQTEALISGEDIDARVEFYWPEEHHVIAPFEHFKGALKHVSDGELNSFNTFEVYGHVEGLELRLRKGLILAGKDTLYYMDFAENGIDPNAYYDYEPQGKQVYEITDAALKAELMTYIQAYYDDGVGIFYDDAFTEKLSTGVLIALFAGVPGLILICAVVLGIKSKGYQRKTWIVTAALSGCTVVVFSVITVLVMRI